MIKFKLEIEIGGGKRDEFFQPIESKKVGKSVTRGAI
jgi:hypothetical protein